MLLLLDFITPQFARLVVVVVFLAHMVRIAINVMGYQPLDGGETAAATTIGTANVRIAVVAAIVGVVATAWKFTDLDLCH